MLRYLPLAAAAALTAGCASNPEDVLMLQDSPSYLVGYNDGCATATEANKSFSTKSYRDADAFDADKAYRSGWRQGYMECSKGTPDVHDGGRILGERGDG